MTACATDRADLAGAYRASGDATLAGEAVALARADQARAAARPKVPAVCRTRLHSGVRRGDRLDIAARKTDFALGQANDRLAWCADWADRELGGGQ